MGFDSHPLRRNFAIFKTEKAPKGPFFSLDYIIARDTGRFTASPL